MKRALAYLLLLLAGSVAAQKEFDKYGPMGSQVYTDLKEALKIERGIYKMDLSYKKLEPKSFEKIGKLKDLQALKLSGNEVTAFPKDFSELSNLLYLASHNNPFPAFPADLKKMYNLAHLELSHTKIDSIPAEIAFLNRLKVIRFTDTEDTLKLPETMKYLKNLTDLQIERCIMDSFPKQIFRIPSLKFLYLATTNTHYLTRHWDRLQNLEVLIVENNPLAEIPNTIYQAKSLRFLSLRNNKLTKLPDTISQLENLAMMDLRGNPIPYSEIELIRALLPGCEIKSDAVKPEVKQR